MGAVLAKKTRMRVGKSTALRRWSHIGNSARCCVNKRNPYYRDHLPPHVHAVYQDAEVLIDLRTLDVYRGEFPSRALRLVLEWAAEHHEALLGAWALAQAKQPLPKIAPLP